MRRWNKKDFLTIKEKYNWRKLYGQKEARLEGTCLVTIFEDSPACADFIQYNQETVDGKIIPLADGHYFVLRFVGDKQIPFTLVRRQNYEAMKYYESHIGDSFKIKIER